jgi:hypothetical protein
MAAVTGWHARDKIISSWADTINRVPVQLLYMPAVTHFLLLLLLVVVVVVLLLMFWILLHSQMAEAQGTTAADTPLPHTTCDTINSPAVGAAV